MASIMFNTLSLCITWYGQSPTVDSVLSHINQVFIGIFLLEAVFKLIALKMVYFNDKWNKFDFAVVVLTLVAWLISELNIGIDLRQQAIMIRIMRILRVLRLVKKA